MKKIYNEFKNRINYYFGSKNSLLIYLIIVIGILVPTVSGNPTSNFFYRFYLIINNRILHIMIFLAMFLNIGNIITKQSRNYFTIIRYTNYKTLIKTIIKDLFYCSIYLSVISIILSIAGSVLFCFGDFSFINHPNYSFNIIIYFIFFSLRMIIIYILISCIIFLVLSLFNNFIIKSLVVINNLLFIILSVKTINYFYEMPLLYHYYLFSNTYQNFLLEIICSLIEILVLGWIVVILYKFAIKKKRDLI